MKNLMNTMHSRLNLAFARAHLATQTAKEKLRENNGQFVMDHAVVFVIIIVLGGVALLLLRNYLQNDLSNTLKSKIDAFFN